MSSISLVTSRLIALHLLMLTQSSILCFGSSHARDRTPDPNSLTDLYFLNTAKLNIMTSVRLQFRVDYKATRYGGRLQGLISFFYAHI